VAVEEDFLILETTLLVALVERTLVTAAATAVLAAPVLGNMAAPQAAVQADILALAEPVVMPARAATRLEQTVLVAAAAVAAAMDLMAAVVAVASVYWAKVLMELAAQRVVALALVIKERAALAVRHLAQVEALSVEFMVVAVQGILVELARLAVVQCVLFGRATPAAFRPPTQEICNAPFYSLARRQTRRTPNHGRKFLRSFSRNKH
jgi:hypothetical protein